MKFHVFVELIFKLLLVSNMVQLVTQQFSFVCYIALNLLDMAIYFSFVSSLKYCIEFTGHGNSRMSSLKFIALNLPRLSSDLTSSCKRNCSKTWQEKFWC